ncbi:BA75_03663T0 [Komagataella pastoris]|uniref:BA75_03663T0 n=1 Tax=Komagataella pastoris TaxID=4922 RepID=A0A1B2JHA4_PICPA|nr:BA75_03663T0 [Komagataella pastoris]
MPEIPGDELVMTIQSVSTKVHHITHGCSSRNPLGTPAFEFSAFLNLDCDMSHNFSDFQAFGKESVPRKVCRWMTMTTITVRSAYRSIPCDGASYPIWVFLLR